MTRKKRQRESAPPPTQATSPLGSTAGSEWPTRPWAAIGRNQALILLAILLALGWLGWNSINYVTALRPGPDAGEYVAGGMLINEGRVLYKDIGEFQFPGIYFLNALALRAGDGTFDAIRQSERLFAVVGAILVFLIILRLFSRPGLAFFGTVGFLVHFYSEGVLEQGNVTEEYGAVFVLAGILCTVLAVGAARFQRTLAIASGACFASAAFIKAPFLYSSIPWFLFLVWPRHRTLKGPATTGLYFVLGSLLPALTFVTYLVVHAGLGDWLDTFAVHFAYVRASAQDVPFATHASRVFERLSGVVLETSWTARIGLGLGIVALTSRTFLAKHRFVPVIALLAFLADLRGATTSGRLYGHYFLQVVPAYLLTASCGMAFLLSQLDRLPVATRRRWGYAMVVLAGLFLDRGSLTEYWNRLRAPFVRAPHGEPTTYIRTHARPGDQLWSTAGYNSRYYVETGLTSPIRYNLIYSEWFIDTPRSTAAQKVSRLATDLAQGAPAWIIAGERGGAEAILAQSGVAAWICANYVRAPVEGAGFNGLRADLYVRRDRARAMGLAARSGQLCR